MQPFRASGGKASDACYCSASTTLSQDSIKWEAALGLILYPSSACWCKAASDGYVEYAECLELQQTPWRFPHAPLGEALGAGSVIVINLWNLWDIDGCNAPTSTCTDRFDKYFRSKHFPFSYRVGHGLQLL
jgi:hypothetical protein